MTVRLLDKARAELRELPESERKAFRAALEKLKASGPTLGFPHTSSVKIARGLRELRPRAGRSPWRAFYQRRGDQLVVAAIGPEAQVDPRGFERAVTAAVQRLEQLSAEEEAGG